MTYLRTVFSLDLRSLALLRMLLASLILVQLWILFPDAEALLSDSGVLPRELLLEKKRNPYALSLYMVAGTAFQVRVLMLIHAVIALGLLVGFRTRWCAILSWILLMSLHNRNPWMLNGGDIVMTVLSFWILFLPIHARASLDLLLNREQPGQDNRFFDISSVALILQICLIYWSTAHFKTDSSWFEGDAVRIALECDQFVGPIGIFIRELTPLHAPLTWATIIWEAFGPFLLFIPIGNRWWRLATVSGFVLFHGGLEVAMYLGLFPAVCIAAWLALLPPLFWDWANRLVPDKVLWIFQNSLSRLDLIPGALPKKPGPVSRILVFLSLAYVILWVFRGHNYDLGKEILPREANAPAYLLRIHQKWNMFSPGPPRLDGWFVMRGRQFNGNEIDLLTNGAPLTWEKPELVISQYRHHHWRKYFRNLRRSRHENLLRRFVIYSVEQWNGRVDVGFQVREVELYFMLERTLDDGVAEPEKRRLWYWKGIKPDLN